MKQGWQEIDAHADVLDSREIIARIEYLEAEDADEDSELSDDEREELTALKALAEQGETLEDWPYGVALVHENYWVDYAREYAEDTADHGARELATRWPYRHIDWEAAADELRMDYTDLEFRDQTFYAR